MSFEVVVEAFFVAVRAYLFFGSTVQYGFSFVSWSIINFALIASTHLFWFPPFVLQPFLAETGILVCGV